MKKDLENLYDLTNFLINFAVTARAEKAWKLYQMNGIPNEADT